MVDSRVRARNIQEEPRISCSIRKLKKCFKMMKTCQWDIAINWGVGGIAKVGKEFYKNYFKKK